MIHSIRDRLHSGRILRLAACFIAAAIALGAAASKAAPILLLPITLPGNSSHDAWTSSGLDNVNNSGYPGIGGFTDPWPAPIPSNIGDDALFDKTSGGGYPLAPPGGIYSFFAAGNFELSDLTPVSNLATVVFQIHVEGPPPGGVTVPPVLNYNAGGQALAPLTSVALTDADFLFQWNLTGAPGPINNFEIQWGQDQHNQIFEMRLDQSDLFLSVPEPGSIMLAALAGLGAIVILRRRAQP